MKCKAMLNTNNDYGLQNSIKILWMMYKLGKLLIQLLQRSC